MSIFKDALSDTHSIPLLNSHFHQLTVDVLNLKGQFMQITKQIVSLTYRGIKMDADSHADS